MIAKQLDDVLIYRKALEAADAVSAIPERSQVSRDFDLKDQLSRSSGRMAPLIAGDFGQLTDRHMAACYANARGSALETCARWRNALGRRYLTLLTPWINYLQRCQWKERVRQP